MRCPPVSVAPPIPYADLRPQVRAASGNGNKGFNLQVVKEFICDNESGSFFVKLQVKVFFAGPLLSSFNWVVTGGDGAYADLHGSGSGVGVSPNPGFDILDLYSGKMHVD